MLFEHLDPTRRILFYTQLFVVNASITVRLVILEHGKDNAQHLVRQRDDRLLMTLADVEGTKQPPAEAGGFGLRTGSPDTRRLNDASYCASVLKSSFEFGSKWCSK